MKHVLLTMFMVVSVFITMTAQDDERTTMPVIHYHMDVEPIELTYKDHYSNDYCKEFYEEFYHFVEIENTDEDEVTIYYRYTDDGETDEWQVYDDILWYAFENDIVFEGIEAYAQADGKLPSEICYCYCNVGTFRSFSSYLYYINGYYYINRANDEYNNYEYENVAFTCSHPRYISDDYYEDWDGDESLYSGEIVVPDQVLWNAGDIFLHVKGVDYCAFANSTVTRVVLPNTIRYIDDEAFSGCKYLTSVEIPNSVYTIGEYAFADCSALTSIVIPGSLNSIYHNVFSGCTGLTNVEFHDAVYSIGQRAFWRCTGLTSIELPKWLSWIDRWAFSGCTGLTSVTIPSRVDRIGDGAFDDCSGLTELLVQAVNPPRATRILGTDSNVYNSVTLFVPNESLAAYQAHEEWGKFSHIVPFIGAGPGDVDGDGSINIIDVTSIIDIILSGDVPAYCDVDGDGIVNITDITYLIDKLLNGN